MELRNLNTFLKVAELCHFTKAAESLGYVQSTVTAQIQQLEAEIGEPLFERFGKKVMLTSVGQDLLIYANQISDLCEQAVLVGNKTGRIRGRLRIGVVESLYTARLSNIVSKYNKSYPYVKLSIHIATGAELIGMINKNELDIIYVLEQQFSSSELKCVNASLEEIVFVGSKTNELTNKSNIRLCDIIRQDLVMPEKDSIYRKMLEGLLFQEGLEVNPVIEINNTSAIISLLKDFDGVTFLPRYVVENSEHGKHLAILDVSIKGEIEFSSQLIYHKDKWVTEAMKAFLDMLS